VLKPRRASVLKISDRLAEADEQRPAGSTPIR